MKGLRRDAGEGGDLDRDGPRQDGGTGRLVPRLTCAQSGTGRSSPEAEPLTPGRYAASAPEERPLGRLRPCAPVGGAAGPRRGSRQQRGTSADELPRGDLCCREGGGEGRSRNGRRIAAEGSCFCAAEGFGTRRLPASPAREEKPRRKQ